MMSDNGGNALERLMTLRDAPLSYARDWKERTGGKVIGYFCSDMPEEIIHASGALPVRLTGQNRVISASASHLQSYCCSLARTALDMSLEDELDFLDGTAFVHTCDTMQRLSDIWRLNTGYPVHLDAVLPVRYEGEAAWEYLLGELDRFRHGLEELTGPIDDESLWESIRLYNRNRELLARIYDMRLEDPSVIPYRQAVWLAASSALVEKSEHNALLEEVLQGLEPEGASEEEPAARLFGIGSVMDQWEFLEMVENVGGTFVNDDFCNSRRYFDTMAPEGGDPLEAVARRVTGGATCPCKHVSGDSRRDELVRRIEDARADGVVFFQFMFCEPHGFDYPYVKQALDERGIPSMLLEIEQGSVSVEAMRTRVEAFLETMRG